MYTKLQCRYIYASSSKMNTDLSNPLFELKDEFRRKIHYVQIWSRTASVLGLKVILDCKRK